MYYKPIDKRSRKAMTAFLQQHFRYLTMNSWNQSTSYANCIKLHHVKRPETIDSDTWWHMLEIEDWHDRLSDLLDNFGRDHDWTWQAGINGRSGGYVVLYRGGIKPSGYKSYCTQCGQKNYQAIPEGETGICGRCNAKARINFQQTHMQVFTWPGKSVDMGEDFGDWSLSELQERVELVQDFDRLTDDIAGAYTSMCQIYRIVEEEILVPKTIKVLEPTT
ncbi:hypothetical protein ACFL6U_31820 [Planctomycetota bacterium]